MLIALLVVLGILSYQRLGVDLYPAIELPYVGVIATLPGASVEEVESRLAKPIEEAINPIEGIDTIEATASEGVASIRVGFVLERDPQQAAQDVRDNVAAAMGDLPPGISPPIVRRFDLEAIPILQIAISGDRDLRELTEITREQVEEELETLRGVGSVSIAGDRERAIHIIVDTDQLDAFGLSIQQVRGALRTQNIEVPGGRIDQGSRELVLRTLGRIESVSDFGTIVVGTISGRPVLLRDLATIEDSWVESRSHASLDGRIAITLSVQKQSGANTVATARRVREKLKEIEGNLPSDIALAIVKDQSRFIKASIDEAKFHLLLGGLLVGLSTLIFMGDGRSTLIAAIAIPTSIIATFTAIWAFGFTLNQVTLLALILSVGVVIDDAVVVLENIYRHMEELGKSATQAAIDGTKEIGLAVMATTLSLIVIFVPLAFTGGMTGQYLYEFGITTAFAILFSMIVSFVLTPMLCSRYLKVKKGERTAKERRFYKAIEHSYMALLRKSLDHRWVVVVVSILIIASIVPLGMAVGKDFIPTDDESEFQVAVLAPEGYTLGRSTRLFEEVASRLAKLENVDRTLLTIGDLGGLSGKGQGDVTRGSIYVGLAELDERDASQNDIMLLARTMMSEYPEVRSSVQSVSPFGGGRRTDFEFDLLGDEIATLAALSATFQERLRKIPGFVDLDSTLALRKPEVQAHIDRQKAADLGIRVQDIASTLRMLVGGQIVSTYKEADEQYDVWMRAGLPNRTDPEAIYNLRVARPGGEPVRLSNLVTLSEDAGPARIDRRDRRRQVTIVANLEGLVLGDAVKIVKRLEQEIGLPAGYSIQHSHYAERMTETANNFLFAFGLSAIFMYMVLAAQFESFVYPISILLSLPLSIPFALLSLLIVGNTLNLYSGLGLFMLFGIVKKNGILQIDYTNQLRAGGMPRREAILQANQVRLRPILMTTVMLVAGLLPVALGTGTGAASRASMANVIIGGQALCLVITLLVTPVAYSLLDDLTSRRR